MPPTVFPAHNPRDAANSKRVLICGGFLAAAILCFLWLQYSYQVLAGAGSAPGHRVPTILSDKDKVRGREGNASRSRIEALRKKLRLPPCDVTTLNDVFVNPLPPSPPPLPSPP